MRLLLSIGVCLAGGCSLVYNNQYDDRAGELEELRTEVFAADLGVKLIATGGSRLFWVDFVRPGDQNVLHSFEPPDFTATTYQWSEGDGDSQIEDYHFGEQIALQCTFSTAIAYSATSGANVELGRTGFGSSNCAVEGGSVYFLRDRRIDRWTPNGPPPSDEPELPVAIDFDLDGDITGTLDAFGVIGNLAVVTETGGDIYTVNLGTKETTWLENDVPVSRNVFFDDKGVLFDTNLSNEGPHYIQYSDRSERTFRSMVADGGYHLSFKHDDIQTPAESSEFFIHGRHIIYRGNRGIFAYGLDTGNVVDLLLDRGEGIDLEVAYHSPTVTKNGFLYVKGLDGSFNAEAPIYQVDLNGRLR